MTLFWKVFSVTTGLLFGFGLYFGIGAFIIPPGVWAWKKWSKMWGYD